MILIFSTSRDQATNGVVTWLEHFGQPLVRINDDEPEDAVEQVELTNLEARFMSRGVWYSTDQISAVWYRKGRFWFLDEGQAPEIPGQAALSELLGRKLKSENRIAGEYFQYLLKGAGKRTLGNPILGDPNKLIVLHKAQSLGIKTPLFEVTDRLGHHHLSAPSGFITKALSDGIYLWDREGASRGYFSYTEDLGDVLGVCRADERIPLSLIQQKIAKRFEVRSFYLDGKFASAAIYSQEDPQTATDYRKYNTARPNRNVPIKLSADIEDKLRSLFLELELNTGSVDMIVDDDGEFVFLEINPVGIYGSLQGVCNYAIDRAIANWLRGEEDLDWC